MNVFSFGRYFVCLILLVQAAARISEPEFNVVSDADGSYSIRVGGETWLKNGPTFFRANNQIYSTRDGSLKMINPAFPIHGVDALGAWHGSTFCYSADGSRVNASIQVYEKFSAAIFTQTYVSGFKETSSGDPSKVVSGFPSFHVGNSSSTLGYLAYDGFFIGWINMEIGRWDNITGRLTDGLDSGPLVLFDQKDRVLIISPFDRFMAASFWHDTAEETINWGIMGRVNAIRQDYTYSTVIFYGSKGINQAVENWGEMMRLWYGRKPSSRDLDPSINYIGYYTDNGGYYYQRPEPGMNFEDTLLGVYNYSVVNSIPYRYLQYDDWFYPTAGPTSYGATVIWDAKPSVFPHGLNFLYNKTRLPVVAHNRYWSDKTPYAKQNGGQFNFVFDGEGNALPDDQTFWNELFAVAKSWGLETYEQDWLNYQIESIVPVQSDLELGTRWLHQMGKAAELYGVNLQYCMALPRHMLATLELPAVSQIRVSIDYMLNKTQYKIGISSLFAHALGVAPFKDNFWTEREQPGNIYHKKEENPSLQAIISLLSTGPVGISDKIGYTDLNLVQRLITKDGLLLKPSRPATAINAQILQSAFGGNVGPAGEVWTTYSDISGFIFGVILAMDLRETFVLKVEQGNWGNEFESSIVYSSEYFMPHAHGPAHFNTNSPLPLVNCSAYTDLCYYYTSPVMHIGKTDVYIKGEMAKALPISPKRITSIAVTTDDLSIELSGSPSEEVAFEICTLSGAHSTCVIYSCIISGNGKAHLSLSLGPHNCR